MSYSDIVLADNPTGFWPLQGDATAAAGNDGTVIGATFTTNGPGPGLPECAVFDGVDDEIRVGSQSPNTGPGVAWTYEGWVTFASLTKRDRWLAQSTGGGSQAPRLAHLDFTMSVGEHGVEYRTNVTDERPNATVTDTVEDTWYHVVAVHTGTQLQLYIDGVLRDTTDDNDCHQQTGTLAIGSGVGEHFHHGLVAGAAVYNYALSPARIEAHYDAVFAEPSSFDPAMLNVTVDGATANLSWSTASMSGVTHYDIFRRVGTSTTPFNPEVDERIARVSTSSTTYADSGLPDGNYCWQVFPVQVS
jgi:hypothetical protein